jgi:hypothetical protein
MVRVVLKAIGSGTRIRPLSREAGVRRVASYILRVSYNICYEIDVLIPPPLIIIEFGMRNALLVQHSAVMFRRGVVRRNSLESLSTHTSEPVCQEMLDPWSIVSRLMICSDVLFPRCCACFAGF